MPGERIKVQAIGILKGKPHLIEWAVIVNETGSTADGSLTMGVKVRSKRIEDQALADEARALIRKGMVYARKK